MSIYKKFCTEVFDEQGNLQKFSLRYPENFNFAEKYDSNCYKDLSKSTKAYLNSSWETLKTGMADENEPFFDLSDWILIAVIAVSLILIIITTLVKKHKRKRILRSLK